MGFTKAQGKIQMAMQVLCYGACHHDEPCRRGPESLANQTNRQSICK
jgi:hypothetical protein